MVKRRILSTMVLGAMLTLTFVNQSMAADQASGMVEISNSQVTPFTVVIDNKGVEGDLYEATLVHLYHNRNPVWNI